MYYRMISWVFLLVLTSCSIVKKQKKDFTTYSKIEDSGVIFEVNDFKKIFELVSKLEGNIIVAIDNNDVITEPQAIFLKTRGKKKLKAKIKKLKAMKVSNDRVQDILSGVLFLCDPILLDKNAPCVIKALQKKKDVKVILCTNSFVGKYGVWDFYEEVLYAKLLSLGIDFAANWHNHAKCVFENLPKNGSSTFASAKNHPIFFKGMLLTSSSDKGDVLKNFLARYNLNPDVLVFVDDKYANIIAVKKVMDEVGVKTLLIKYLNLR